MLTGLGQQLPASRWSAGSVLGIAYLVSGGLCLLAVAFPYSDRPMPAAPFVAALGLGGGALLFWWAARLPQWVLVGCTLLAAAVICELVHDSSTAGGQLLNAVCLVWVGAYAAWFFSTRNTLLVLVVIAGLYAIAQVTSAFAMSPVGYLTIMANVLGMSWLLHVMVRDIRRSADHDLLTGLLVRAAFLRRVADRMVAARRNGDPMVLVLIDLDGFKTVNDSRGHAAGDQLLADLASTWRPHVPSGGLLARYGGDEFALLLDRTTADQAHEQMARLAEISVGTGWSYGAATWEGERLVTWLERADQALYEQKRDRQTRRDRST